MEILLDPIRRSFPGLPGGPLTLPLFVLVLIFLVLLYRRTRWGGWLSFLVAGAAYMVPFLASYRA
jgi:hypothetical protein